MNKPFLRPFGAPAPRLEGPRDLDDEHLMKLVVSVDSAIAETNSQCDNPETLTHTAHDVLGRIDHLTIDAVEDEFARLEEEIKATKAEWAITKPAIQRYVARVIERVRTYTSDHAELREFLAKRNSRLKIPD